jgi:kynureninase
MKKTKANWDIKKDLDLIRKKFPILKRCVYLISNSLGAVPARVKGDLKRYYSLWAEEGVTAWQKDWWLLSGKIGNKVASIIGAGNDEVTMLTNATQAHWISLSTQFKKNKSSRNKIVMTDHDFPSTIYAVTKIAGCFGWEVELVKSYGKTAVDTGDILKAIDDKTLFVAVSHVGFKSAQIQDIFLIAKKAGDVGAMTLIDGYHAPGTIPVDVKKLGVDFYIGGCLKWLCGGPGNAFLYVRPELAKSLYPQLTGWLAHSSPFSFSHELKYSGGSYRFMSGTPAIPALYTAEAGIDIIEDIGITQIREKSQHQTQLIIEQAKKRDFALFTPENKKIRGGAVSVLLPHAYQVKQALEDRGYKVDFRKGENPELDLIRVGPHFYTADQEIIDLFHLIDELYASGDHKKYPEEISHVT